MPFPSAGSWAHTTLMTSTVVREKQELQQQSGEIIPEWPSAIVKDAGGEIPPGPAGSATMDKNFIYWPRVQLYESSLYLAEPRRRRILIGLQGRKLLWAERTTPAKAERRLVDPERLFLGNEITEI